MGRDAPGDALATLHRPVARPPPRVQIRVHTSSTSCVQCSRVLCSPRGPRPGRTWSPISGPRETQLVGGQARSAAGAPAAMRSEAGERRTRHVARLVGDCPAAPAPTTATGRKEGEARQPSGGSRRQRSTGAGGSPRMRCRDAAAWVACGGGPHCLLRAKLPQDLQDRENCAVSFRGGRAPCPRARVLNSNDSRWSPACAVSFPGGFRGHRVPVAPIAGHICSARALPAAPGAVVGSAALGRRGAFP